MSRQKKYLSGPTKTVRLPAALSDYLLLYADNFDRALVETRATLLANGNLEVDTIKLLTSAHMQAALDHSSAIFVAALASSMRDLAESAAQAESAAELPTEPSVEVAHQAHRDLEPDPSSLSPHSSLCPFNLAS